MAAALPLGHMAGTSMDTALPFGGIADTSIYITRPLENLANTSMDIALPLEGKANTSMDAAHPFEKNGFILAISQNFFLKKTASVKVGLGKMRYSQGELLGHALRLMRGEAVGDGRDSRS
jgi:hypothetical protein